MRTSVQNGTDDEIHNDGIDHDEIELTKCLNELDEKTNCQNMKKNAKKISLHDEIELTTYLNELDEKAKYQNMKEKAEKTSLRTKIVSNPKGIKLNPKKCWFLGEMKFVLSNFLSNEDLSISYES